WVYALDKQLAETEVAAGRYAEALAHVPPAQIDKMLNDKKFKNSFDFIQYQAHLGLGDTEKAIMYLQKHVEGFKAIALEQEKKEYNRAAVQLGLQIEAERNAALAKRNELQSDQIQLLQKFRLVSMVTFSLSIVVLVVLYIVRRQAREIQVSRKKMKEVLDNIDEGILTLDRDLKVLSGYSPYLDRIFSGLGSTLEGWPIHRLLYSDVDASECVMMAAALQACMGEDTINWELNASHLPTEICRGDRLLQLHWQDLTNRQNIIHSFLVSIRDITEQRATENALKEQNERLRLLQQKLGEILAHDVAAIRNLLGKIHEEWVMMEAMLFQNSHISQAFQRLHGWKGAARTLGLMQLASHVHALESCLDLSTQSLKDRDQTHKVWLSLKIAFQDYESLMGNFTEGTQSHQPQNLFDFAALYTNEFESRLRTHGMGFQGLAIQDGVRCWRPEALQAIHEVLQHALSNALDHGFIRPGWKIPAWIRIEALLQGHEVVIHALDNGAGIDWATLRAKAQRLGLPTSAEGKPKELLFREGVSTADGTLATSGRGIGLSAVQSICKEWGGTVTLDDAPHQGTLLTLRLPADRVLQEAYPKAA
ncbi:MAG: ATP-binding protein, partial [Pseudobdellovibrionaceae bacterium]|nr:ATP-binding protein [Pseudobdellovibrionaceae bacterium]